jgi:hypothetical protein
MTLAVADLEQVWLALAETMNTLPVDKESLFLAKTALLLSNALGDLELTKALIAQAAADLEEAH